VINSKPNGLMVAALALVGAVAFAQGRQGRGGPPPPVYRTEVPDHAFDVVLGQLGADRVEFMVRPKQAAKGRIAYGSNPAKLDRLTPEREFPGGIATSVPVTGLKAGSVTHWRLELDGNPKAQEGSFTTLRPAGSDVVFTIQADSHLDSGTVPKVYLRSLEAAKPTDFLVDLGDTFMVDKYRPYTDSQPQYLAQRWYFSQFGKPVFFVNGNHDGEQGRFRDSSADNMADWSRKQRTTLFPSGERHYWSATTGDVQLIGLDPYWYTNARASRERDNNWHCTLGKEQYDWLSKTLAASSAHWKFVFIHNLVGGHGRDNRGGATAAHLWEWGGQDTAGANGFPSQRPGWEMPIHALLLKHQVNAVFHGHDHLYVKEQKDGIVYQTVPQASHGGGGASRSADEYGYSEDNVVHGAGVLRVSARKGSVEVVFLRTDRSDAPTEAAKYTIEAKQK